MESHDKNCGRYKAPVFLKRCRLPKSPSAPLVSALPGGDASHTLLNVVRSRGPGRVRDAVLLDNLEATRVEKDQSGGGGAEFYHMEDLEVGATVWVGGRDIVIYDCDEATRTYCKEVVGKGQQLAHFTCFLLFFSCCYCCPLFHAAALEPLAESVDPVAIFEERNRQRKSRMPPPHNGFGSEEDSLTSCNGLEPRPPQRDFKKFMNRDRWGQAKMLICDCDPAN